MNLRETLSQHPRLGRAVAAFFVLLCIVFVYLQAHSSVSAYSPSSKAFFSVDDGKTWFVDASTRVPPFDKDGKEAVQAFVYRCGSGPDYVGYLQRFTPSGKHTLEQSQAQPQQVDGSAVHQAYTAERQVKRPGAAKWVSAANISQAAQISVVICPDGGAPDPVQP